MRSILRHVFSLILFVTLGVLSNAAWAAPVMSVPQDEYDAGVIPEGSRENIKHSFTIKNTGDEVLKIEKVNPG